MAAPTIIPRQLLIGLDAAEWDLVLPWAQAGKLPAFRRLIDLGTRAVLATTAAQLPDTVWASLYSGCNPARYEKYFYVQYDARTNGLRHVADDAIRISPFWDHLSRAGRRVGVVDAPKFRLSEDLNGFQITNWGAHATKTARASTPGDLLAAIETRFGRHPVGDCDAVDDHPGALDALRRRVLAGVRRRGQVNRWLMQEQPWDLFFTAFSETHCIGHHFWRWQDPTHPRHERRDPRGLAGAILEVYQAIDREIGEMLSLVDDQTVCMLFSGHGMGPLYHASWNLPEILDRWGLGRAASDQEGCAAAALRTARVNPWRRLKRVVPGRLQYGIKRLLPRAVQDQLLFKWYTGGQRWAGCRAFAVPNNDSVGAIRIGLRGRDRDGLVSPGDEYVRLRAEIAAALMELTDPETGRPVVQRVSVTADEFVGPYLDQLPDLTVLWDSSFQWGALHSPRFGTLQIRQQDARSGSHTPHGFLLAMGPGIPAGVELNGHSIYDIAPTVLEIAGVRPPEGIDGRALALGSALVSR